MSKVLSIPEDKKDILETIASIEKREVTDIISEVISKMKGKTLDELDS
ncbi:MAG: hypothetical protein IEMM0008_1386 [bacterium]|nr:MAG: hypothetical protein IEMM0008_1386 [bacterium]